MYQHYAITALSALLLAACSSGPTVAGGSAIDAITNIDSQIDAAQIEVDRALWSSMDQAVRAHLDWALIDGHTVSDLSAIHGQVVVATNGGILFFRDGLLVDRLTAIEGLQDNHVRAMTVDTNGSLWMSFGSGGCQRLTEGSLQSCPPELDELRITDWTQVGDDIVAVTRNGQLLEISRSAEVHLLETSSGESTRLASSHKVTSCGDSIWVGSRGRGLGRLDGTGSWSVDWRRPVVEALSCRDGDLFVGGPDGLWRRDGDDFERIDLSAPRQHVTALFVDSTSAGQRDGALGSPLLVGLADGGLWILSEEGDRFLDLPQPVSVAVFVDEELWLGGSHALFGLSGDGFPQLVEAALPGPGSTDVSAIASARGKLALGLFRDGVAIWQGEGWRHVDASRGLPSGDVNGLAFDSTGSLWVATSHGLARLDDQGEVDVALQAPELPCDHVNAVLLLPPSSLEGLDTSVETVALATSCGVGLVNAADATVRLWESRAEGLPHRIVYSLAVWDGRLVAGTNDGLAVRELTDTPQPWTAYLAGRSLFNDNWITAIAPTPSGHLAVGTYSGGLFLGDGPSRLWRVPNPQYVNLNAMLATEGGLLVGGLSEGAYLVDNDGHGISDLSGCVVGPDVTGFALWDGGTLVASRSGVGRLDGECAGSLVPSPLTPLPEGEGN